MPCSEERESSIQVPSNMDGVDRLLESTYLQSTHTDLGNVRTEGQFEDPVQFDVVILQYILQAAFTTVRTDQADVVGLHTGSDEVVQVGVTYTASLKFTEMQTVVQRRQ